MLECEKKFRAATSISGASPCCPRRCGMSRSPAKPRQKAAPAKPVSSHVSILDACRDPAPPSRGCTEGKQMKTDDVRAVADDLLAKIAIVKASIADIDKRC